ncbi:MAG: hypothetical protein WA971_01480, partial [Microbacterium sp.]
LAGLTGYSSSQHVGVGDLSYSICTTPQPSFRRSAAPESLAELPEGFDADLTSPYFGELSLQPDAVEDN